MKCKIPGCKNKAQVWYNVWNVCLECQRKLLERDKAKREELEYGKKV